MATRERQIGTEEEEEEEEEEEQEEEQEKRKKSLAIRSSFQIAI